MLARRRLLAGTLATLAAPLAAGAQLTGKIPTVGFLGTTTASAWASWTAAFVMRLRELGWTEGRTVAIEYRWAEGRADRLTEIVEEFIRLKVDVIATSGGAVLGAKRATSVIPIVFAAANDPVGVGLVASLAKPGGNVTGVSLQSTDLVGKRIEVLREVLPRLRRLAIMANTANLSNMVEVGEVQTAGRRLGVEQIMAYIRNAEDIELAVQTSRARAEALYVCGDPVIVASKARLVNSALDARLPTIYGFREYVEAGGLISYGANYPDQFRRAAEYVDKILRGAKPGDLPVQQPTRFDLVINLNTARALGLIIPPSLRARADQVIE